MGTRHSQCVITKEGDIKVRQYGQWDGYPSGQGVEILKYLRNGDLDKYQEELAKITEVTEKQIEKVNESDNWSQEYPFLSRDCGSDIHQMIEDGEVPFVQLLDNYRETWCEGFYIIDFQNNTFTSSYGDHERTFPLDDLPTKNEYLRAMGEEVELTEEEEELRKQALAKLTPEEINLLGIEV